MVGGSDRTVAQRRIRCQSGEAPGTFFASLRASAGFCALLTESEREQHAV